MIKNARYNISPLPTIPVGSQFIIHGQYAKINADNILEIYNNFKCEFYSTNVTLSEYNDVWIKSKNEYTLREFLQHKTGYRGRNYKEKDYYFFFDPSTNKYKVSYNQPVKKGFKKIDGVEKAVMKAGECYTIDPDLFPQIINFIKRFEYNNIISLYAFEHRCRMIFEGKKLQEGYTFTKFDEKYRVYEYEIGMSDMTLELKKFTDEMFYEILEITLEKKDEI